MNTIEIETISAAAFEDFGTVIEIAKDAADPRFQIIVREDTAPWRIAVLCASIREASRVERHPNSMESFEPMGGFGVLLVAPQESPDQIRAFALDRPICLHKGIWHEVVALSPIAQYKITENNVVTTEFHNFAHPIKVSALRVE